MAQARASRRIGKRWGVKYMTKHGEKNLLFLNMTDIRASRNKKVADPDTVPNLVSVRNEIAGRLKAKCCELCGATEGPFEVHHVRRLKDLTGNTAWEQKMWTIRRKTLIVCKDCHKRIHE